MPRRGRPPKITPELAAQFCGHIADGVSKTRAAALIGINAATLHRWIALSRAGKGGRIYASFASEVARAEARFIAARLATVVRASRPKRVRVVRTVTRADGAETVEVVERVESDWLAAKWLLECKDRETFGPDRHAIAALRKELAELRALLTERIGRGSGTNDGEVMPPTAQSGADTTGEPTA